MTDRELIEALRHCFGFSVTCNGCPFVDDRNMCDAVNALNAADRLEALLAENERLKQNMQVMKYGFYLLKSCTHTAEPPSTEGAE